MSFRFHRSIPNLSIFHNTKSSHSTHILQLLRSSLSNPYVPQRIAAARAKNEASGTLTAQKMPQRPLEFNLDIATAPPTVDQYQTMLQYLRSQQPIPSITGPPSLSRFLVKHSQQVSSADELADLASRSPEAVRWPVVVHWDDGLVAIEKEEEVDHILDVIYEQSNGKAHQQQDWLS